MGMTPCGSEQGQAGLGWDRCPPQHRQGVQQEPMDAPGTEGGTGLDVSDCAQPCPRAPAQH